MATSYDVIILGGGPAGYVCAIRAAQLGLSTAVVEKDKLGGVCVNIGCIPTKALLHSAYVANLVAHDAKDLGVAVTGVTTDYGVAMRRSRKVAEQNSKGVEFLMKKHKVAVIRGTGTLGKNRTIRVGADEYQAKKAVVIATGSRVKGIPQIGLEINKTTVISSDEALFLETVPQSLAVIGAGAVGCEFTDIFNAFGSKVTLIEVLPRILPIEDAESSDALAKSYRKRGIAVFAGAKVTKALVGTDKVTLTVDAGGKTETIEVEKVLMAAGRAVNTEGMGFQEAGVKLNDRGFVQVDPVTLQTTAPGIYSVGDVAGAQGVPGGHERSRADRGTASTPDQVRQRPQRHLLSPRGSEHRPHGRPGEREETGVPGGPFPFQRQRPRPWHGRNGGVRQDHPGQEIRGDPRRTHRRQPRLGADSRAGSGS